MSNKIYVFIFLFVCGSFRLAAQNYYIENERTFYGGLILGRNFSQVDGDNFAGYHKSGFNIGGIVYTKFEEHLAVSMEVLYSQKGAKSKDYYIISPGRTITDYNITLNYAEVPIMLSYFDKRKSHFGAGVSYSRLGTSTENIVTVPSQVINTEDFPFKKSDYNFLLSGSLHCWKGFFLNLRFQYSLVSIRNKPPENFGRNQQFNNMYTLRIMYLFM